MAARAFVCRTSFLLVNAQAESLSYSNARKAHRNDLLARVKRRFRLVRSADFQRVRRFGKAFPHSLLVVVVCSNEIEALRIGVVAGRVVGNAVQRNRAKRLLRQAIRPYLTLIPPSWDILLIARQPLAAATFDRLQEVLADLLRRSKILRSDDRQDAYALNNG